MRCYPWVERDGRLYLLTTDGAPRFRLAVADPATPGREHWRELVAEDPDSVLDGVAWLQPTDSDDPADALLALARSRHAAAEVALHDRDGTPRAAVPLARPRLAARPDHRRRGHTGAAGPAVDRVDRPGHPPAGAPVRPDERRDRPGDRRPRRRRRAGGAHRAAHLHLRRRHPRTDVRRRTGHRRTRRPPGPALRLRRLRHPPRPRLQLHRAGLGRSRRRLRAGVAARRRRGGRGLAPRRATAATSRTCSTTSTPPRRR